MSFFLILNFCWSITQTQKSAQTLDVQLDEFAQNEHSQGASTQVKEQKQD